MLTRLKHQYALSLCVPDERSAYRLHMCGLCHALGDDYGQFARLFTTREIILLNLLVSAQQDQPPEAVARRCPLNPLRRVISNRNEASKFAAAVSVELANASFLDDIEDSQGGDFSAHLAVYMLRHKHRSAQQVLSDLNMKLLDLPTLQNSAEKDDSIDPTLPTALATAQLFRGSAQLAGVPENADVLADIGQQFGAYIYLLDAYRDFASDMAHGCFNPLAVFAHRSPQGITLSDDGLRWLAERFRRSLEIIQFNLDNLHLPRYRALITRMLCDPLSSTLAEVENYLQKQGSLIFPGLKFSYALKAAFFIVPPALAGLALTSAFSEPGSPDPDQSRRRRSIFDDCGGSGCHGGGGSNCDSGGNACEGLTHGGLCEPFDCDGDPGWLGDCGGLDCAGIDCGGIDCGNIDCAGADCAGADFGDCAGAACESIDWGECAGAACDVADCGDCAGAGCDGADCG